MPGVPDGTARGGDPRAARAQHGPLSRPGWGPIAPDRSADGPLMAA